LTGEYNNMYRCHVPKHEDTGMWGQFVVVDP